MDCILPESDCRYKIFIKSVNIFNKRGEKKLFLLYTSGDGDLHGMFKLQNATTRLRNKVILKGIALRNVLKNWHGDGVCIIEEECFVTTAAESRNLYKNTGFLYPLVECGSGQIFKPMAEAVKSFLEAIPHNFNHD